MKEFYRLYQVNYLLMSQGIILTLITISLLFITVLIASRKAYHEVMAFVMAI